jgi:hypothetical protein
VNYRYKAKAVTFLIFSALVFTSATQNSVPTFKPEGERVSDFSKFIHKFYYNMAFQKERVVFPCLFIQAYTLDDIPTKEYYTKDKWKTYDRNKEIDAEITIEINSHKKISVNYFICGTDYSQVHQFELINGKWFLTSISDYSV